MCSEESQLVMLEEGKVEGGLWHWEMKVNPQQCCHAGLPVSRQGAQLHQADVYGTLQCTKCVCTCGHLQEQVGRRGIPFCLAQGREDRRFTVHLC
jgi:hypothetical protein